MNKTTYDVKPASPLICGVFRSEKETSFVFSAPAYAEAELHLFREEDTEPFQVIPLTEAYKTGSVYAVSVALPAEVKITYLYRVNGVYITDPYSRALQPVRTGEQTMLRSALTAPVAAGTSALATPFEDCVFYKLHVRGFSKQKRGGIKNPGTFAGIAQSIPYFKELGVNALLFMPVYEFFTSAGKPAYASLKKETAENAVRTNYWGYTKGWYFTPKQSYSASENAGAEFAAMVDALHKEDILCIPEFYFDAEEDPRLVTDVLRYWLLVYHVDGFRLVGDGGWLAAVRRDPLLKGTKLLFSYCEEDMSQPVSGPVRKEIAVYNADFEQCMRRFLKGDLDVGAEDAAWMQRRNAATFTYLSYFADQDGFTLADAVSYEEKHNEANGEHNQDGCAVNYTWNCGEEGPARKAAVRKLREKQIRNAMLFLMTAQGVPMIYAGDEMWNSQDGNNNAWCQDNPLGWVTWRRTKAAAELQNFVKEAIRFRKQHPVLHRTEPLRLTDYRSCGLPDLSYHSGSAWMQQSTRMKAAFGALYCGSYAKRDDGSDDDTLYILYNMYWQEQSFALPDPPAKTAWFIKADTSVKEGFYGDGKEPAVEAEEKCVAVPPRTICILIAKAKDNRKAEEK